MLVDEAALLFQFWYELFLSTLRLLLGVLPLRHHVPSASPFWFLPMASPTPTPTLPLCFWLQLSVKRPIRFFLPMDLKGGKPSRLLVSDVYLSSGKNKGEP